MRCQVCTHHYGTHRQHCPVCGASKNQIFWLFDGPNTWAKSHIDVDRPIARATNSLRDIEVVGCNNDAIVANGFHCVVDDPVMMLARELADDQQ